MTSDQLFRSPALDLTAGRTITLYDGRVSLRNKCGAAIDGTGVVTFDWIVGTRLSASLPGVVPIAISDIELENVALKGSVVPLSTKVVNSEGRAESRVVVALEQGVRGTESGKISRLMVYLCNLPGGFAKASDPNPVDLNVGHWKLWIDELPDARDRFEKVKLEGGGSVTHLVGIERSNGGQFNYDEAEMPLDGLRHLINFAFGRRVAFLLPTGFGPDGGLVVEIWGDPRRHTRVGGLPWLSVQQSESLPDLWPKFFGRWTDPSWQPGLRVAIELYVDAHSDLPLETRVLIAQAALELLAWQWLIRNTGELRKRLKALSAAAKLTKVLSGIGAPIATPPDLNGLSQAFPTLTGPEALTRVRNLLAHPTDPREILNLSHPAKLDVWRLSLWYFDLVMFHVCGFAGQYVNRTRPLPLWETATETPPLYPV